MLQQDAGEIVLDIEAVRRAPHPQLARVAAAGQACEATDQRTYTRAWDGGTGVVRCDRGAVERCTPTISDLTDPSLYPFVAEIMCRGITSGCGGTSYCPNNPVTREQMAVFLVKASGEQKSGAAYNEYFDDVANNGFALFINRIKELGITAGCGERLYCPASNVDRKSMAVFLIRAMGERPSTAACDAYFTDLGAYCTSYAPYINRLAELGVAAHTTPPGAFGPDADLLRWQMAVYLVRGFFQY